MQCTAVQASDPQSIIVHTVPSCLPAVSRSPPRVVALTRLKVYTAHKQSRSFTRSSVFFAACPLNGHLQLSASKSCGRACFQLACTSRTGTDLVLPSLSTKEDPESFPLFSSNFGCEKKLPKGAPRLFGTARFLSRLQAQVGTARPSSAWRQKGSNSRNPPRTPSFRIFWNQ